MNLVGKIFIVLIFVMSLVFMSLVLAVYSTHENWRNKVKDPQNGLEAQLKKEKDLRQEAEEQLDKKIKEHESEQIAYVLAARLARTQAENYAKERNDAQQLATAKDALAREAIKNNGIQQENWKDLAAQLATLRTESEKLLKDRTGLMSQVVELNDRVNKDASEHSTLRKRAVEIENQLIGARTVLDNHKLPHDPAMDSSRTPSVEGRVLSASQTGMEISIGSDQGLRVGHKLVAYRLGAAGGTYLGTVEVISVQPDRAVCKGVPPMKGQIQKGDRVADKINP
jgi:hypothetical protein